MKKLLCSTVFIFTVIVFSAALTHADPPPLFHISNLRNISGGNDAAKLIVRNVGYGNDLRGGRAEIDILGGKAVKKPVNNKIPTAASGLINPRNPIVIIANGDKIIFSFDDVQYVGHSIRILDSKGRVLASMPDKNSTFELRLSGQEKDYYVEVKDYLYFYVLIKAKSGSAYVEPTETVTPYQQSPELERIYAKNDPIIEEYMRQHSIRDRSDLTQEDWKIISERFLASLTPSERALLNSQGDMVNNIVKSYMKEHSITDENKLTMQDWKVIQERIQKAENAQGSTTKQSSSPASKAKTKKKRK